MDRRSAIAGLAAWLAATDAAGAATRLALPASRIKARPIRWPAGDGGMLHGFMAIPGRAGGKQPAVLVLADPDSAPGLGSGLAVAVAQAGLVACAPDPTMIAAAAADTTGRALRDLEATIAWLRDNAYATGAVGLLATQGADALLRRLAPTSGVAAAIVLGGTPQSGQRGSAPEILVLPAAGATEWANAWQHATTYLREHLQ